MKNKITRKRIASHLNYDWIKYICIILACVVLWSILFSFFGPKLSSAEQFEFIIVSDNISLSEQEKLEDKMKTVLRRDIKETAVSWINTSDKNTASTIEAKTNTGGGDAFIFLHEGMPVNTEDETITSTYLKWIDFGLLYSFDELLNEGANLVFDKAYQDKMYSWSDSNHNITDVSDFMTREEARVTEINRVSKKIYNMLSKTGYYNAEGVLTQYTDSEEVLISNLKKGEKNSATGYVSGLALYYNKNKQSEMFAQDDGVDTVEKEEKIWGVNLDGMIMTRLSSFINNGFDDDNKLLPINYAFGIADYNGKNEPFQFEGLFVLEYILDTYM